MGFFFLLFGCYQVTKLSAGGQKYHFSHFYTRGELVGLIIQKRAGKSEGRQRFWARVISVGHRSCRGEIYVNLQVDALEKSFFFGDTLWTRNTLYPIRPPLNPGGFDFRKYAASKNVSFQLYLKRDEFILKSGEKWDLRRSSVRLNRYLQTVLEKILKEPGELSVAKALLLGDKNEIPDPLLNSFKGAGAMHILAISGLHVGIIHLVFMFLTRPLVLLKNGRILRVISILAGLWGYALLTGMAVSVFRSVSMFTLLTLGHALNRKSSLFSNLINSAFILLILNPMFLFDVGFQLSYSALTGIAVGAVVYESGKSRKKGISKVKNYFFGLILVSCFAQLGVMPLSLYYFKQFSGLFLISSILLLPVLGFTLVFGYSVLAISLFYDLPLFVHEVFQAWLALINKTIYWLGSMDALILEGAYFPFSFLVLMSVSLCLLIWGFHIRRSGFVYASGICLLCMQAIWAHQKFNVIRNEKLLVFHRHRQPLVVKRMASVLELKKCDSLTEQVRKNLQDYAAQLPGDFSIQSGDDGKGDGTVPGIQHFFVEKSLVCLVGENFDTRSLRALRSLTRTPDIVVLSNAPRVNLERLLKTTRPSMVVADGSNHKGFMRRCSATCHSLGIEFHETREKGAFLYPQ